MKKASKIIRFVKFDEKGLVPAVVQDYKDGTVLMVAYMNRKSLLYTLKNKIACFWSRSRQELWIKGKTSGNIQKVTELFLDCDADCLLVKVRQVGGAACHTGYRSCFYRKVTANNTLETIGRKVFDPKKVYGK